MAKKKTSLRLPESLLEEIDAQTDNRTAFIEQACYRELERRRQSDQSNSNSDD